ncbi:MAG TPA: hypothetical protein VF523_12950, partial [Burkholderiales bacterium]
MTPQPPAINDRPRERGRLLLYLIPGLAALLVVTLFALAFVTLAKSRDASLHDAERSSRNLVQIVEQRAARMLQSVDAVLSAAAGSWQQIPQMRDPAGAGMHSLLAQGLTQLPFARSLFVLDARGMLVLDSGQHPVAQRDFSDREFFTWHRSHTGPLHIGKPAVNRAAGEWFIVVTRRLDDAEGRFAGTIGAALEPAAFRAIFGDIDVGREGVISLMHEGGELIASAPEAPSWLGMPTGANLTLKELAANHGTRTVRSVSAVDGVARIYSAR